MCQVGSGEVGVLLVALPAAAQDGDAEEVQHRQAGVDRQAQPRGRIDWIRHILQIGAAAVLIAIVGPVWMRRGTSRGV
jgi:hypothetical protein